MVRKVYDYIEQNRLLENMDTIVVGVSGGADSVCLLSLLCEYSNKHPLNLIAAHVHHGLRDNADGDEEFVKNLCGELQVPLRILHIDAAKEAQALGISVEEAGRVKRYEFFNELAEEAGEKTRIAVAHHRDDLCETMLFQLFRGSGIHGLRGILPLSGNIIRPLLCVSKDEIRTFLLERGITWREDESNDEDIYARNRIRHEILPLAEQICSGAAEHMAKSAVRFRELEDYLDAECDRLEDDVISREIAKDGKLTGILLKNSLFALPKAICGELILRSLCRIAGRKRDIGSVQVEAVEELYLSEKGKERLFIYGIQAKKDYDGIRLNLSDAVCDTEEEVSICLISEVLEGVDLENPPKTEDRKWFDYDLVGDDVVLRRPADGDYLYVKKDGRKQIKDYCKDEKIPETERKNLLVAAKESLVLWIIGRRMGEFGKVSENTKRVLQLSIKEVKSDVNE